MQIRTIDGFTARCTTRGVERDVSLLMMQETGIAVNDFVVVHIGYAIQKSTPQEAQSAGELFDRILESPDA
jgi:hydrogenase expression/formation protein HypC